MANQRTYSDLVHKFGAESFDRVELRLEGGMPDLMVCGDLWFPLLFLCALCVSALNTPALFYMCRPKNCIIMQFPQKTPISHAL